ncbi:hypothetical protein B0J11DRAFT_545880 [Dendryphion nanum]|uniref:Fe2OG dioxygenase domain-containing protein n=1 Tax=Dendryphion nanum TaxID=256645 RepID=A0A9P9IZL7_9PLEO|nr:hypothetical protein B0J11DRAFT_545880 [Dendryphion nanum]
MADTGFAAGLDSATIPIVDFGKFLNGTDEEKKIVGKEIDDAFRNVGFVYLKNHGVSAQEVAQCFEWSKKFFDLPLETKMLAPHPPGGAHHRGYSAPGLEAVSQHVYDDDKIDEVRKTQPDYKESFESGNTTDASQPNIWPPDAVLPGFRPFLQSYFLTCTTLIHQILDSLSTALDVPAPGLSPTHSKSLFQLRILHYPPISAEELRGNKNRSRINAHSDFGTLTLLFQDAVGGLEIEDPHQPGTFRPAPPIPETVLVNIGDLMARWSNDRWRSTVHRVGVPQGFGDGEGVVPARYSIPFFATADMETVIEALPGCWGEAIPRKYDPVTAWGYVQMRMKALYEE